MPVFDTIVSNKKTIFPENYQSLSCEDQNSAILSKLTLKEMTLRMKLQKSTIGSILAMKTIQENTRKKACNRYII
jgi:hypothetical protein